MREMKWARTRNPGVRGSGGGSQGRQNPFERYLIAELDALLKPDLKSSIEPSRPRLTGASAPRRASSLPHLRGPAPVPGAAKAAALQRGTSAATHATYTTQFVHVVPARPRAVAAWRGDLGAQSASISLGPTVVAKAYSRGQP